MDQITDLRELLKHELKDLYSAETQLIEGMPLMIETARNPQLKKALSDHLKVTRDQKVRLDKIEKVLNFSGEKKEESGGFFANLFESNEEEQHCKAMEGLIKEANSLMDEDMTNDVMDAAIIAAAQKIEHYEIGSYGTARAYAEQMGMKEVEKLLRQTLDEEYFADDSLTKIALENVNIKAEGASGTVANSASSNKSKSNGRSTLGTSASSNSSSKKSAPKKSAASGSTKASANNTSSNRSAAKKGSSNRSAAKKTASKKSAAKKTTTKKSAQKKVASSRSAAKRTAPKKSAAKKASSGRSQVKRSAPKRSVARKSSAKKSVSKKSAPKKTSNRRAAPKKVSSQRSASGRSKAGRRR